MKLFILLSFSLFVSTMYAQWGVSGGVNLTSGSNERYENSSGLGFQAGIFYDIRLSDKFVLQPQLAFIYDSFERRLVVQDDSFEEKSSYNSFGILLPLLVSYRHPMKSNQNIRLDLGLFANCGLFGSSRTKQWSDDLLTHNGCIDLYPDERTVLDIGLMGGVGYEINRYILGIQIKRGFYNTDNLGQMKSFMLNLGYNF